MTEKAIPVSEERIPVAGSRENLNTYIEQLGRNGLMVRYAEVTAEKQGEPVEILQITDMHLNAFNERDEEEKNPATESSRIYRTWCRNGASAPNAERAMTLSAFADQTVVTGDSLDYLTWGALELLEKTVWEKDPNALVTLGGHDTTRKMQGLAEDPTTYESRAGILQAAWKHDIFYTSKILKNRVMLIQMDNGNGDYTKNQFEKLKKDLEKARREALTVLIFQHEPISTGRPEDAEATPLRVTDPGSGMDLYGECKGGPKCPDSSGVYGLICSGADVIKGIFCGHYHNDFYTEIRAKNAGSPAVIPQYVLTGCPYDSGHALWITVK